MIKRSKWVSSNSHKKLLPFFQGKVPKAEGLECWGEVNSGSGQSNCIVDNISGTFSNYGVIAGGVGNCIYATQSTNSVYNVIGGGSYNTISACYSAILGGKRNTVSHNYAGVFGNGISTVAACTFYVNCLNACDTPGTGTHPIGTIFAYTGGGIPSGACPLYIQL